MIPYLARDSLETRSRDNEPSAAATFRNLLEYLSGIFSWTGNNNPRTRPALSLFALEYSR